MTILEQAKLIVKAADSKKAQDIVCLEVTELTPLADYFVICSASNMPQIKAIAEEVEEQMSKNGFEPKKVKAHTDTQWILLDYDDVMVHIFITEAREFYKLENLWVDANKTDISDIVTED